MVTTNNLNILPLDITKNIQKGNFYLISDTHFGHQRCFEKFEPTRQLIAETFEEFEIEIIKRWNEIVSDNDIIIIIGDFCINKTNYNKSIENIKKATQALNGRKILIKGNHDIEDNEVYFSAGFEVVIDKPINIHNLNLTIDDQNNENIKYPGSVVIDINGIKTFISHFGEFIGVETKNKRYATTLDFFSKRYNSYNCVNLLHGHSHSNSKSSKNIFNASIEENDFKPVHYSKVIHLIS